MSAGYTDEEFCDLMDAGGDHDTDAARGDEQRDALNLPGPAANATLQSLITETVKLQLNVDRMRLQNANMLEILKDLVRGADMVAPVFSGAALGYIKEVRRVAQAGIEAGRS